ncbi:MAG: DUF1178 family protein [Pseudomonadota bacterium]
MIRYALKCAEGHTFEAWFGGSQAYDRLARAGQLSCAVCGSNRVEKAVMAPAVTQGKTAPPPAPPPAPAAAGEGAAGDAAPRPPEVPQTPRTMLDLCRAVLSKSEYVGDGFATEARRIHDGEAEERGIWGEATRDEAESLREDGIPAVPLPLIRKPKN